MNSFFKWIKRFWQGSPQDEDDKGSLIQDLANMLKNTRQAEYSCDEAHNLLDQYAEMEARGEDVTQLMPLIKQHLDMCKDCNEEYEALMRILKAAPA